MNLRTECSLAIQIHQMLRVAFVSAPDGDYEWYQICHELWPCNFPENRWRFEEYRIQELIQLNKNTMIIFTRYLTFFISVYFLPYTDYNMQQTHIVSLSGLNCLRASSAWCRPAEVDTLSKTASELAFFKQLRKQHDKHHALREGERSVCWHGRTYRVVRHLRVCGHANQSRIAITLWFS